MDSKTLLTIREVAPILRVSVPRCYELVRAGLLPSVRIGRQLRIDPLKLRQWIDGGGQALAGGWCASKTNESTATRGSL